jgi:hypothetical protein
MKNDFLPYKMCEQLVEDILDKLKADYPETNLTHLKNIARREAELICKRPTDALVW